VNIFAPSGTMLVLICLFAAILVPGCRDGPSGSARESNARRINAQVGDEVCRADGHPWAQPSQRTVIVVGSATCPACTLNEPVEERLFKRCSALGIPVAYVIPDRSGQDDRIRELESQHRNVVRMNLRQFGISRTPTLVAIDRRGEIVAEWAGTVPEHRANEIIDKLISGQSAPLYQSISIARVSSLLREEPQAQLISLSAIGGLDKNGRKSQLLPLSEIGVRARYELLPQYPVIIDCRTAVSAGKCQDALLILVGMHFNRLFAVDLEKRDKCSR
jgi:hypothetical protein